jgi:hypothetical protein
MPLTWLSGGVFMSTVASGVNAGAGAAGLPHCDSGTILKPSWNLLTAA